MKKRLIIWLICRKVGVKPGQCFRFTNQKSDSKYFFEKDLGLIKIYNDRFWMSGVSLNWLLDPECEIETLKSNEY